MNYKILKNINFFIVILLILSCSTSIFSKTIALITGVSDYNHPSISDLSEVKFDLFKIESFFDKQEFEIYSAIQENNATKKKIISFIKNILANKVGKNDRFIFYFAGHANIEEKNDKTIGHLLAYPGDDNSKLKYIELLHCIKKNIKAYQQLFIIDACHSGSFYDAAIASRSPMRRKEYKKPILPKNISDFMNRNAFQIIASSMKNQKTVENYKGYKSFTSCMIDGFITGEANTDNNCWITFKEISTYVSNECANEMHTPLPGDVNNQGGQFIFTSLNDTCDPDIANSYSPNRNLTKTLQYEQVYNFRNNQNTPLAPKELNKGSFFSVIQKIDSIARCEFWFGRAAHANLYFQKGITYLGSKLYVYPISSVFKHRFGIGIHNSFGKWKGKTVTDYIFDGTFISVGPSFTMRGRKFALYFAASYGFKKNEEGMQDLDYRFIQRDNMIHLMQNSELFFKNWELEFWIESMLPTSSSITSTKIGESKNVFDITNTTIGLSSPFLTKLKIVPGITFDFNYSNGEYSRTLNTSLFVRFFKGTFETRVGWKFIYGSKWDEQNGSSLILSLRIVPFR